MRVWSRHIQETLKKIDDYLLQEYKDQKEELKRDWRTYEQRLMHRMKSAIKNLEPLIEEAISTLKIEKHQGRESSLTLKQKVILLLLKELFDKSNRDMSVMTDIFSLLSGIDVSYKTVERLYSDEQVEMTLHNLHLLILKKRGIEVADASGDGTGYSLTIKKHYATEVEKRKEQIKEASGKERSAFIYSFKLLDLKTRLYICYGMSFRSEKQAFNRALEMLKETKIKIEKIRLDRYYSNSSDVDKFPADSRVFVFPKSNATLKGSYQWKDCMIRFVLHTKDYLGQYYLRNNSESEIAADKRRLGWRIEQRREDRINTAHSCTVVWHNLFNLYTN